MAATELLHQAVSNNLNVHTVLIFTAVLALTVVWFRRPATPRNLPPGPRAWPIIGNMLDLRKDQLHNLLDVWAKQYGSITRIWLGPRLAITLNDINTAKEALVKQGDCFSDRMGTGPEHTGTIIMSDGEIWKERRRFGLSALRTLGMGKQSIEQKINEESRRLIESFDDQGENAFDPEHTILNAVSNIICTISFGYRFEYSDPKFAYLIKCVKTTMSFASFTTVSPLTVLLRRLLTSRYRDAHEQAQSVKPFVQAILKEHQESFDPNDIRDIIDMYLEEIRQIEKSGGDVGESAPFCRTTLWRGVYDLFVAGTDTSTNTLLWILLYIATYQDVQEKVQREIDNIIGSDRQPNMEDRNNMPYTKAVIMEMLRLQPVVPFGVPHATHYQTELLGYTIPEKTLVFVNNWSILRDPKYWKNPEEFDPSRFLSQDGKLLEKPESFFPFSLGRRVCMGETLAKMEVFLFFVNLLQRFTFSFPAGKPRPSLEGIAGVTLAPRQYEVVAKKR